MTLGLPFPLLAMTMALAWTMAPALAAGAGGGSGHVPATVALEPARVGWSVIELRAAKLFLAANARVELGLRPAGAVALRTPPGLTVIPPGSEVVEMVALADGAGRRSRTELYLDPVTGAALQRHQHDYQGRLRERTYRYGREGAFQWTRWPRNNQEKSLPPAQWTKTSQGLRAYPAPSTGVHPGPVLEGTGLLYAIAAAPLDRPGDEVEFHLFSRRALQKVTVTVVPGGELKAAYDQRWPSGTVRRTATLQPIRLTVDGEPMGGDPDDEELELLGLRGNLEIALEPETRAPLEITGNVKLLGRVTLKLTALKPR